MTPWIYLVVPPSLLTVRDGTIHLFPTPKNATSITITDIHVAVLRIGVEHVHMDMKTYIITGC